MTKLARRRFTKSDKQIALLAPCQLNIYTASKFVRSRSSILHSIETCRRPAERARRVPRRRSVPANACGLLKELLRQTGIVSTSPLTIMSHGLLLASNELTPLGSSPGTPPGHVHRHGTIHDVIGAHVHAVNVRIGWTKATGSLPFVPLPFGWSGSKPPVPRRDVRQKKTGSGLGSPSAERARRFLGPRGLRKRVATRACFSVAKAGSLRVTRSVEDAPPA